MKTSIGYLTHTVSGFGLHGYTITDSPVKTFAQPHNYSISEVGYVHKVKGPSTVNVAEIIDRFTVYDSIYSNGNDAEVKGISLALAQLSCGLEDQSKIILYVQSGFVIRAIKDWVKVWSDNNWKKRNGSRMDFAEDFKSILELQKRYSILLTQTDTLYGFDRSAVLSRIASNHSEANNVSINVVTHSPTEGYYKKGTAAPSLFFHPNIYIQTQKDSELGLYVVGKPAKDDTNTLGRRSPDSAWGIVLLPSKNSAIEILRSRLAEMDNGVTNLISIDAKLLFKPESMELIDQYGKYALTRVSLDSSDLFIGNDIAKVTQEFVNLQHTAIFYAEAKKLLLKLDCIDDKKLFTRVSLVPYLFDVVKNKLQLKKEFGVGASVVKVDLGEGKSSYPITLGDDLPERNLLKRIEAEIKEIDVVLVNKSTGLKEYYIFIELLDGSKGLFKNFTMSLLEG